MSRSVDPGHFFQTDTSDANAARKAAKSGNKHGNPISLTSKILAVLADPTGAEAVYVAESAGTIRRVDLKTKEFKREVYRGPTAPLTSLCIHKGHIYAGCWDKSIWSWPLLPSQMGSNGASAALAATRPRQFHGHSDFVKAVVCTALSSSATQPSQTDILISGGQDAKIIIWNAQTGTKLKALTGHARGVLSLAILPTLLVAPEKTSTIDLFSGGSEGQIRRWRLTSSLTEQESDKTIAAGPLSAHLTDAETDALANKNAETDIDVIAVHETSVNALLFAAADLESAILEREGERETNDGNPDAQLPTLYTASSDNAAMALPARPVTVAQIKVTIEHAYRKPSATLLHADFVRAIAPLAAPDVDLVATACRDEGVRIWDSSEPGGALLHCYEGHYEEVTGLAVVGASVVSVSIDGTVRTWPGTRAGVEEAAEAEAERQRREDEGEESAETEQQAASTTGVELDADEEAELAALMDEDD